MRACSWKAALLGGVAAVLGGQAALAQVTLSGLDGKDGTYSDTGLQNAAMAAPPGDTVISGSITIPGSPSMVIPASTGISIWGLLGGATTTTVPTSPIAGNYDYVNGAITTPVPTADWASTINPNQILRDYLVATNGAGAVSIVSLGEIDPMFGGTAAKAPYISYTTPTPDLIVPGAPARDLIDLTSLALVSVPALPALAEGVESTTVTLSGLVSAPNSSYTQSQLENDFTTAPTVTVSGDTYTGTELYSFLGTIDPDVDDQIVVTTGTDDYQIVLSLAELDTDTADGYGGNPNNLLAYASTGSDFPTEGVARTIFPNDNKHGRFIQNLDSIDVEAVPEPGSISLFAAGLLSLGLVMCRRRA